MMSVWGYGLTRLADFRVVVNFCQILFEVISFDGHDLVQNVHLEPDGTLAQVVPGRGEGLRSADEEFLQVGNDLRHENVVGVVL